MLNIIVAQLLLTIGFLVGPALAAIDLSEDNQNPSTGNTLPYEEGRVIVKAVDDAIGPADTGSNGTYESAKTFSSISSNFNGTPIPAGDFIWFNSHFKVIGLNPTVTTNIVLTNSQVVFDNGGPQTVTIPDAIITFDPNTTCGSTAFSFDTWQTSSPSVKPSDEIFLSGVGYLVPAGGLPGGINPVTWEGHFYADQPGIIVQWQWSAAVYSSDMSDENSLGVKAAHQNDCTYINGDHAGTPENKRAFVVGGARGGGGSNFTGSNSATRTVSAGY